MDIKPSSGDKCLQSIVSDILVDPVGAANIFIIILPTQMLTVATPGVTVTS